MDKNYLAGLIEGEGCFGVYFDRGKSPNGSYRPRFQLTLRDDDEIILNNVLKTLGISKKLLRESTKPNPVARIALDSINDLMKLINFLDDNPFFGKKRLQYDIWKKAVLFLKETNRTAQQNLERRIYIDEHLKIYHNDLKALKKYKNNSPLKSDDPTKTFGNGYHTLDSFIRKVDDGRNQE